MFQNKSCDRAPSRSPVQIRGVGLHHSVSGSREAYVVILFIDQIGRWNTKHIHKVAIRGGGNTKLMALPAQQALLFRCCNRLSRTNCCFQLALMVVENHIIIQRNELLWTAACQCFFSPPFFFCIFFFLNKFFVFLKYCINTKSPWKKIKTERLLHLNVTCKNDSWYNFLTSSCYGCYV